jgi:hypothetical protein
MVDTVNKPSSFSGWTEPESAANTDYQPVFPYNNATQTASGHAFEMDDTPTRERIRLQHRTLTFIEMHPNGDEVHKICGDGYEIILKDKNMLVNGNLNITVKGNANIYTKGSFVQVADEIKIAKEGVKRAEDNLSVVASQITDQELELQASWLFLDHTITEAIENEIKNLNNRQIELNSALIQAKKVLQDAEDRLTFLKPPA